MKIATVPGIGVGFLTTKNPIIVMLGVDINIRKARYSDYAIVVIISDMES